MSFPAILDKGCRLTILLDSPTFQDALGKASRKARAILAHHNCELLRFLRTPSDTDIELFDRLPTFSKRLDGKGQIQNIDIVCADEEATIGFPHSMCSVAHITELVYGPKYSKPQLQQMVHVLFEGLLNECRGPSIFITEDRALLRRKVWLESHFPGKPPNLCSIDEACLLIDLFLKKNGTYSITGNCFVNKGWWYFCSARTKLPHYNVEGGMVDAAFQRFMYALMAVDYMGCQHFIAPNNDTINTTLYHFNCLIMLITGIFDALALKTHMALGIKSAPSMGVSLNPRSGEDFLKCVKSKAPELRKHIENGASLIKLVYSFRETVVHRQGLEKSIFEHYSDEGKFRANIIKLESTQRDMIKQCGDSFNYNPFSTWGVLKEMEEFFEPYIFSLELTRRLATFVDKYLELLGLPSFVDQQRKLRSPLSGMLLQFEQNHLGF